jgi:putative multiple sugar transport system permease protein
VILQNSYVMILAIGMLLCILTGNIDLSVGSVAAFVSAASGVMIVVNKMDMTTAIIISLAIGAIVGAWNGFWIAYVRIPAFIVTLGSMLIFRGLTLGVLQGKTLGPYPSRFQIISSGFLPDSFGSSGFHVTTLLVGLLGIGIYTFLAISKYKKQKSYGAKTGGVIQFAVMLLLTNAALFAISSLLAASQGIPNVMVLLTVLILAYSFITNRTTMGRHIYAFGGNQLAARLSGIKTDRVFFWVYVNMSILAALAGLVYAGRLNAASPKAGNGFELDAIASCFIGGASASGGIGTISGAIIGALIMGVMNNGMSIMGLGVDWQQAIKGLVLILAVAFDMLSQNKGKI